MIKAADYVRGTLFYSMYGMDAVSYLGKTTAHFYEVKMR